MIALPLATAIVCWVLFRLQQQRIENTVREAQLRMYALRDELRAAAIDRRISPQNWVFQYLDSTLAKGAGQLPELNLWRVLALAFIHRGDARVKQLHEQLEHELRKPKNHLLFDVYDRYIELLGRFLVQRHSTLRMLVASGLRVVLVGSGFWNKLRAVLVEAPETSTLQDFDQNSRHSGTRDSCAVVS